MNDEIALLARLEAAEQKAAQLQSLLDSYEISKTFPPPPVSCTDYEKRLRDVEQWQEFIVTRFDDIDGKMDMLITRFEAHSNIMERVAVALREPPPQCTDCPLRKPHLSLAPVASKAE